MRITVDDKTLESLNRYGPWLVCLEDDFGRRIGEPAKWTVVAPHHKAMIADAAFPMQGKRVLEIGPFDGYVTASLCGMGAEVTAIDARPECLLRTFARLLAFGYSADLRLGTADCLPDTTGIDLIFHSGVFYHLQEPAAHLHQLRHRQLPVFLDTCVADAAVYKHEGYGGRWHMEGGWDDQLAGLSRSSFWMTKGELLRLCEDAGFRATVLRDDPEQDGGARLTCLLIP